MSLHDKARIVCKTIEAALKEEEIVRQLALIDQAKVLFDEIKNEVWSTYRNQQVERQARDWK